MGGCYITEQERQQMRIENQEREYKATIKAKKQESEAKVNKLLKEFTKTRDIRDFIEAYNTFTQAGNRSGFFLEVAKAYGINSCKEIPNEFPGIEYEVKFEVSVEGDGEEPNLESYLNAFAFPVCLGSRFVTDPVNNIASGINSFYGDSKNESVVVIEKCGKTYLKEKSAVLPLNVGVRFQEVVIKRTEDRYEANLNEILKKVNQVTSLEGVCFQGAIEKEKGDSFILDLSDMRIYSMTFNRSHLLDENRRRTGSLQRQLEVEYAGFLGTKGFNRGSEKEVVGGMVDLAKHITLLFNPARIKGNWTAGVALTSERKYDFIIGNKEKGVLLSKSRMLELDYRT